MVSDISETLREEQGHREVADEQDGHDQTDERSPRSQPLNPLHDQGGQREERDGEDHEHEVGHARGSSHSRGQVRPLVKS